MNQNLFCFEIISLCIVCGVADYISDTTDTTDITGTTDSYCSGSKWIAYKYEKCFKLIKKLRTRTEADRICNQEYLSDSFVPTLVSIKSADEEQFLTRFVFNTSRVKIDVWLGAKRTENGDKFVWDDGSDLDFTNWAEGSPSEEIERDCLAMQSRFTRKFSNISDSNLNGKWMDVPCESGNYVLCQKLQTWSLPQLQKTLLDARKELKDSLENVSKQLSDTRNQLDNTKNELTTTKNDLNITKNDFINTNNELTTTKNELQHLQKTFLDSRKKLQDSLKDVTNELSDTRNQLDNTKNKLSTTKNDIINVLTTIKIDLITTKIELATTKNDFTTTKNSLTTTINELTTTKNELKVLQKNPIPIGFIYVQLPGQPEPSSLWGSVDWIEITSEYAGLFFRVLGGGSEHFGVTQEENSPRLVGANYRRQQGKGWYNINILSNNEWSSLIESGGDVGVERLFAHLSFKVSKGEVRPRNKAIRIWKRD